MATVLVIEDDSVSQRLLKSLLTKRNHTTYITSTISEGIEELEQHTLIDIVVLDNQLKGEFGWQFLQKVRQDFVFQHIPVIVYSASSDRNSVLRYLQLGVQKILVKPYSAKNLEEEIESAVKRDWRGMIFEPVDRVCQRLSIGEDEYYNSLATTANDVLERITHLNRLVGRAKSAEFRNHLSLLGSSAVNLGISILENATDAIQRAADEDQLDQCIFYINRLVPTARLMQHRSLAHFGMTDGDGEIPDGFLLDRENHNDETTSKAAHIQATAERLRHRATNELQSVLNNPLHTYANDLAILQEKKIFTREEILETVLGDQARNPVQGLAKSLHFILNAENEALDHFQETLRKTPWLSERLRRIAALNEGRSEIHDMDINLAIQKIGLSNCACIVGAQEWLRMAREDKNPLYLETLAQHSLGVALIARELSRKMPIRGFTTAGLLRDIGRWVLALQYPAFYGLALSFGKNEPEGFTQALRKLFGLDAEELGAECLRHWNVPERYAAVTASANAIENTEAGESRVLAAVIQLATVLAGLSGIGYCGQRTAHQESDFTENPAWELLRKENLEIPMAPQDYLTAFQPIVGRIKRQINLLFE